MRTRVVRLSATTTANNNTRAGEDFFFLVVGGLKEANNCATVEFFVFFWTIGRWPPPDPPTSIDCWEKTTTGRNESFVSSGFFDGN